MSIANGELRTDLEVSVATDITEHIVATYHQGAAYEPEIHAKVFKEILDIVESTFSNVMEE